MHRSSSKSVAALFETRKSFDANVMLVARVVVRLYGGIAFRFYWQITL
jgi:hypothetical protein